MYNKFSRLQKILEVGGTIFGLAILLSSTSGCEGGNFNPFLMANHPLYTESELEFDSDLVGAWIDESGETKFVFEKVSDTQYGLTVIEKEGEKEESGKFEAHLIHLGAFEIVDFYPNPLSEGSEFFRSHFLRAHTFARVSVSRDEVEFRFLSGEWFSKRLKDKSVDTAYEELGGTPVLTGTTEEVQRFVDRYSNDDEAFPDPLKMTRQNIEEELE